MRLFLDMDGTLAEYRDFYSLEQFTQRGYFSSLRPFENVVDAVRDIIKNTDIDVYVLSACPRGTDASKEKDEWLDKYLPELKKENRIYSIVGENKADYIKGGVKSDDYLLDDYPKNLLAWTKEGGQGIKLFNGLNANAEKWNDACISYKRDSEKISEAIKDILLYGIPVKDDLNEIQLRNLYKNQTLFIERDRLSKIVQEYFPEYASLNDFNRNYTAADWDFVKRMARDCPVIETGEKNHYREDKEVKEDVVYCDENLEIINYFNGDDVCHILNSSNRDIVLYLNDSEVVVPHEDAVDIEDKAIINEIENSNWHYDFKDSPCIDEER